MPRVSKRAKKPASRSKRRTTKVKAKAKADRKSSKPVVAIVYASTSDEPVMRECEHVLEQFGIPHEQHLFSAHRQPEKTAAFAQNARKRGLRVIIAGAGMAAHLPGVIASMTTLPVLGVPLCGSAFEGYDSLLSMVQMPGGVPVGTLAVGKAGAKNAALLAIQILALSEPGLVRKLDQLKRNLEAGEKI